VIVKNYSLLLIFTYKVGLNSWRGIGMIDREVGYYEILNKYVDKIYFLTYDKKNVDLHNRNVEIISNKWKIPSAFYSIISPFLYLQEIRKCNIIKSNQFLGAWTGALIKKIFQQKIFVIRGGYIWGEIKPGKKNIIKRTINTLRNVIYFFLIKRSLILADVIILTSQRDKDSLLRIYKQDLSSKIHYVYNSIDTSKFSPQPDKVFFNKNRKIITIARLEEMKNIQSLILALRDFNNYSLIIIGDGPFRSYLENIGNQNKVDTKFLGNIPNDELPLHLRDADIFAMPQLYGSGINKAILEAMACGNIVIASNIDAHKVVIKDGYNGFICGTEPASIKKCFKKVFNYDKTKLIDISKNAVDTVRSLYSMASNTKREYEIYRDILK